MTNICISKLNIVDTDNGLSPGRCQAIIWTSAGILLIQTMGTNFSEICSEIYTFSSKKMHFKMSTWKWWPFCLLLNVTLTMEFHSFELQPIVWVLYKISTNPSIFFGFGFGLFFISLIGKNFSQNPQNNTYNCSWYIHYSYVPWASWHLKSPITWLFQQLILLNTKGNINGPHYWPFVMGIH